MKRAVAILFGAGIIALLVFAAIQERSRPSGGQWPDPGASLRGASNHVTGADPGSASSSYHTPKRHSGYDKMHNGSRVSRTIPAGTSEHACAKLAAEHMDGIDVAEVKSESMWGGKYTVWYRDHSRVYSEGTYTRKCQVSGAVRVLSVFQTWD